MEARLLKRAGKQLEPEMTDLIQDTLQLKARVDSFKGHNSPEVEKALDDATSAFDIAIHHFQDIMGG